MAAVVMGPQELLPLANTAQFVGTELRGSITVQLRVMVAKDFLEDRLGRIICILAGKRK